MTKKKQAPAERLNVYLTADLRAALDKLSEKHGAPLAELIRRAIKQYVKDQA